MAAPSYISTSNAQRFRFLHTYHLINTCHDLSLITAEHWLWVPSLVVMVCTPHGWWCWAPFHVLISHLWVFSGEVSIQILCPFFSWVICPFYYWVIRVLYKFWRQIHHRIHNFCGFSPTLGISSHLSAATCTIQTDSVLPSPLQTEFSCHVFKQTWQLVDSKVSLHLCPCFS